MHHEYMHAYFFKNFFSSINDHHSIIYDWQNAQLKKWGLETILHKNTLIYKGLLHFPYTPSGHMFSYKFVGFKTINYVP
jgi:hypothetical protein